MTFGFMNINPEDLPEPARTEFLNAKAAQERAHMEAIDRAHRVESFVYGLNQENLFALSLLLDQLLASGKRGTMFWSGQVTALLQDRHNVCAIHGVDHEAEGLASLVTEEGSTPIGDSLTVKGAERIFQAIEENDERMVKYRVSFDPDQNRFFCDDCGYMYPTIEDRMLKEPDDCPGCIARAGQG